MGGMTIPDALGAESVTGCRDLQLGGGHDVPRLGLAGRHLLLPLEEEEAAQLLVRFPGRVGDRRVGIDPAGEDPHHRDAAGVGVGDRFEDEGGERGVRARLEQIVLAADLDRDIAAIDRGRHEIHDPVEERLGPDVEHPGDREHREELTAEDGLLEPVSDLFARELALLEVFLHQLLVALGDHLDELPAALVGLVLEVGGDVLFDELSAFVLLVDERFAVDEVDDASEVPLLADRNLDGHGLTAEELLDRLERPVEAGVLPVHLADDDDSGKPVLFEHLPDLFRADLDPGHGVDEDGRAVDGAQAGPGVPEEVAVSGGIDDVDLMVLVVDKAGRGADRDFPIDLFGFEIGDGVSFVHFRQTGGHSAVEEDG